MQILSTAHLGRYFTKPTAIVELSTIDLDKVDVVEGDRIAILVNCPVNHETRFLPVGQVVHIAFAKERLEPVVTAASTHINRRIGQTCASEGKHRVLDPQWPIRLAVERVTPHIAAGSIGVIARPMDIFNIVDELPACMRHTGLVLVGFVIGYLEAMLATVIVCSLDFIPLVAVAGHPITVHVHAHHDDARFAAATRHIGHSSALHGVSVNLYIVAVLVDNGMVEAEDDIAAIAAQADRSAGRFSAQRRLDDGIDAVLSVSRLVSGRLVHELARSRQVIIHTGYIGRIAGRSRHRRHSHQ